MDKNFIKNMAILAIIIVAIYIAINFQFQEKTEDKKLFPSFIGDAVLKSNETGNHLIKNMVIYDNFEGNIIQGYEANYSGNNGTMIIFIAQLLDNISTNKSFNDMIIRNGYNESIGFNESLNKFPIIAKLPIKNPEIYIMQKTNNSILHYTFAKNDKIYWIAFNYPDIQYQVDMLYEVYKSMDNENMNYG